VNVILRVVDPMPHKLAAQWAFCQRYHLRRSDSYHPREFAAALFLRYRHTEAPISTSQF